MSKIPFKMMSILTNVYKYLILDIESYNLLVVMINSSYF